MVRLNTYACFQTTKQKTYTYIFFIAKSCCLKDDGCMQACFCEAGFGDQDARVVCAAIDCFHPKMSDYDR